jgi:hypothetical protein
MSYNTASLLVRESTLQRRPGLRLSFEPIEVTLADPHLHLAHEFN